MRGQLTGVLPEAHGEAGGVRGAERRRLGDHRAADGDAQDVRLRLHAQVVGGHTAVDPQDVQGHARVQPHRLGHVPALVADRLERGAGKMGAGVEA